MNQIILWDDEFHDSHTFQEYRDMGLGEINEDGGLEINWNTKEEIEKDIATMLEQMDSDQVFDWIQDVLSRKSDGDL